MLNCCLVDIQARYVICPSSLSIYIHSEYIVYMLLEESISHLLEKEISLLCTFVETYAIVRTNTLIIWSGKVPCLLNHITKFIVIGRQCYLFHYNYIRWLKIWNIFQLKALIDKYLIFLIIRNFSMNRPVFEISSIKLSDGTLCSMNCNKK